MFIPINYQDIAQQNHNTFNVLIIGPDLPQHIQCLNYLINIFLQLQKS